MYVKVTAGSREGYPRGDFLCEVHPPIYSDFVAAPLGNNARWDDAGNLVHPGDIDFGDAIGAGIEFLHLLEFKADQTEYEKNTRQVPFRYVWWIDPVHGLTAVVTTRHIFILSDTGKTIDRV